MDIRDILDRVVGFFRPHIPYTPTPKKLPNGRIRPASTGNMRFNSVKTSSYELYSFSAGDVYIDDEIAPYVYYTNEPWTSPRWHGKKNPNENWFSEEMLEEIATKLAKEIGGEVTPDD